MEDAERGMYETATSAAALKDVNDRLIQQNQQLAGLLADRMKPPTTPTADPLEELKQWAVPVEPVRRAIQYEAARIAAETVQKQLAPLTEGLRARQSIEQRLPDFVKKESEVSRFVSSNPTLSERYNRLFAADPEGAMEWAFHAYDASQPQRRSAAPPAQDAGIPQQGAGQRSVPPPDTSAELRAAFEAYQATGDPRDLVKARLRGIISDDHVRPNQGV